MEQIVLTFRLEDLRNEAHAEFHTEVETLTGKHNPTELGIGPFHEEYKLKLDDELLVLNVMRKSNVTPELTGADKSRDNSCRSFKAAVKSYVYHPDEAKRKAAGLLQSLLDHFGNITQRSLDSETAAIDDLLRELETGNYPDALATLALTDWTTQLRADNETFKSLLAARYSERAARPKTTTRVARLATDKAYRELVAALEVTARHSDNAALTTLIDEINAIAERYRNLLAMKQGERGKKAAETTQPPTTTQDINGLTEKK